jgi:peptidoglycan hydrolase CwlO-like protein
MTLPQAITLVAVSMAAITAIIAVVQHQSIKNKNWYIDDLEKELSDLRLRYREVVDKLEADLKQADKEFDAMQDKYKLSESEHLKTISLLGNRSGEILHLKSLITEKDTQLAAKIRITATDHFKNKYQDLIAMPRRKREAFIAELRGK